LVELPGVPEAFTLFRRPLYHIPYRPDLAEKQQEKLTQALKDWREDPEDIGRIIQLGRQYAYMGQYRRAIAIFTMGLERDPEDPWLYRHRAHRFLTLRLFDHAIEDSHLAVKHMTGKPDEVEYSGLPGSEHLEIYSLHTNTYYHMGLAYYAKGELKEAAEIFRKLIEAARNDDHTIMGAYWLYMILRRLGEEEEASALLETITADMEIHVSSNYHHCLLAHKGEMDAEEILRAAREVSPLGVTASGNGIANWYRFNGQEERYVELLKEVVSTDAWSGFGYIIAEADLYRMGEKP